MRIIHILNHIRNCGNGVTNSVVELACQQAQAGLSIGIISAGGEYEDLIQSYGIKHFLLDQYSLKKNPLKLLRTAWRYQQIINEFQPDIVHAQMLMGVRLAKLFKLGKPYKLVSSLRCTFERDTAIMGWADRTIAISHAVAQTSKELGIPKEKIRVVLNGPLGGVRRPPIENYQPLSLERPSITTICGMYERKGIQDLIAAFEQIAIEIPEVHLYIVGEGPDRSRFEQQAQQSLFKNRIHFEGFQPEPQRYLLASDIFCLASHQEPFGRVIAEAREAGCAIVATNVDGIPEALDLGKAGILVPPKNTVALATELKQLLQNRNLLANWSRAAKHNIEWMNVKRVHKETLEIYKELV
ncbi:MAG: glycosyltransferase family 4 protein [Pleurocapsa sp. MO_226.B13]|nr:glycosyltransferase family 4 protein [Pleurocapsa sp. MO_226.B13]